MERSRKTIDSIFETMNERLSDGRPYLTGNTFTAADLTFAALSTPVIGPEAFVSKFLPGGDAGEEMETMMAGYRQTRAGKHALRMYEQHRQS